MALAERNEWKDFVGIYYTEDWKLLNRFQVETIDLADLMWTKDNTAIIVWDNPIEWRLFVYSATQGLVAQHIPYENALGYRSLKFSENGQFLAAASFDQKVRIYNHISWKEISEFVHKSYLSEDENIHIYTEEEYKQGGPYDFEESATSRYKMLDLPIKLANPHQQNSLELSLTTEDTGVSLISWSYDSKYIATK